jgi:hypothetical protein
MLESDSECVFAEKMMNLVIWGNALPPRRWAAHSAASASRRHSLRLRPQLAGEPLAVAVAAEMAATVAVEEELMTSQKVNLVKEDAKVRVR